ncbi:MAG: type I secretion system permease/ATPase [Alphaproteobacteria bacterium]|nr:type I secretion system permease/ATPase [Alphaproteobacteria bacterium]
MTDQRSSLLMRALYRSRRVFISVGVFSFFINLAMLNGPLFMQQVYDRVMSSQSKDTLIFLTILAVGVLVFQSLLEIARSDLLIRVGAKLDSELAGATFGLSLEMKDQKLSSAQGLRDLDAVRTFLTGPGLIAMFDAPWTPIFLLFVFMIHPLLGALALGGAVVILMLTYLSELATRGALGEAATAHRDSEYFTGTLHNNSESARAMGMAKNLQRRWQEHHEASIAWQALASDRGTRLNSAAKLCRQALQIFSLALGAWLALDNQISSGAIIAASIIMGRALAPIEATIGQWKSFVQARQAYARLNAVLRVSDTAGRTELPPPEGVFKLEDVTMRFDGTKEPILKGISFELAAGEALGIIGPTGTGKSTLARLMIGGWKPTSGNVRLDGAEVSDWPSSEIGPYVGYLAQDVELLDGTVAENISRYGAHDSNAIVEAAKIAGAHEFILGLPNGYDTVIGERGKLLSGGQRQRVGLARAIYGNTKVVVLDEPNANLDATGEAELRRAVEFLKKQGRTVVIVTHRPAILPVADKLAVLRNGELMFFGPRDEVLASLNRAAQQAARTPAAAATATNVTNLEARYAS